MALPKIRSFHDETPQCDDNPRSAMYLLQFEVGDYENHWTEREKTILIFSALKGPPRKY